MHLWNVSGIKWMDVYQSTALALWIVLLVFLNVIVTLHLISVPVDFYMYHFMVFSLPSNFFILEL